MKTLFILASLFVSLNLFAAEPNLISVNGVGERTVEPNMVVLNIESFGKAPNAKQAQDLQAKEYVRVKAVVEKFKIKKEDFTTENLSVNPEYVYDQKTQSNKITGYRVIHHIKIIYRNMENAGEVVDALSSNAKVENSGVSVQSIGWDSDKKNTAFNQAMTDAVTEARRKADALAKAAGVTIKSVHLIQHNSSEASGPVRPMMEMAMRKSMASDSTGTELSSGPIKVRTEVQMQFEIR